MTVADPSSLRLGVMGSGRQTVVFCHAECEMFFPALAQTLHLCDPSRHSGPPTQTVKLSSAKTWKC